MICTPTFFIGDIMKNKLIISAGFLILTHACPASAQTEAGACVPPINERCDGAIVFRTVDLPFTVSALLGCANDVVDKPYWDVFFRFDCTLTTDYTFALCDSDGDTYIRIYSNACGWSGGTELAVADDECPGSPPNADPLLTIELQAGQSYWIEVGTWRDTPPWGAPNLPYTLQVTAPATECHSDIQQSGAVDVFDLFLLLSNWNTSGTGAAIAAPTNIVDVFDLFQLLSDWGSCP